MIESVYVLCAACTAWFIALCFIKERLTVALVHAALTGLLCGAAAFGFG